MAGRLRAVTPPHVRTPFADSGYDITPPLDRYYYQAAYFQSPGGLRLALATEEPGFLIDETAQTLGRTFRLPPRIQLFDRKAIHPSPNTRLPPPHPSSLL